MFSVVIGSFIFARRQTARSLTVLSGMILMVSLASCGGGSSGGGGGGNSGTPPATYNVTVTGSQSGVNRPVTLALTVN